jgi:alpha-L-rhamnosidase
VIIPGELREQFGDSHIVAQHYASAKKWLDYISGFATNGLISRDNYGDWCVPPENPKLIHSEDPQRKTDTNLLATAYLYYDAVLMADYARLLSRPDDARGFLELAATVKTAFNRAFFNEGTGYYDNGSQTSCVLPLAFGLAPDGQRDRVFEHLVSKIRDETRSHIGTGLIGSQWLMRVLTDNSRADLAYTLATQRTYPSWGYMVESGATTLWELWNGNTADPAMNSGNHVMLVGDLAIWLHENLAGIKPDPAQPGFKHILMHPEPVGGQTFVRATHRSPFGLIASEWRKDVHGFHWDITVPLNATATVYLPLLGAIELTENDKPVLRARGVKYLRMEQSRAVFELGSGHYRFESR